MRYKILKIRMKISYIAFEQKKSILEMFLITILKIHSRLFQQGKITMSLIDLKS